MENNIPNDGHGPLNEYNAGRTNQYNPGGIYSNYNHDGTERTEEQRHDPALLNQQQEVDDAFYAAVEEDRLENAAAVVLPDRRSARVEGLPPGFESDIGCVGRMDSIFFKKIGTGFLLECDGRCYDVNTVINIRPSNSNDEHGVVRRSPFTRVPFTERDNERVELYLQRLQRLHRLGGKKRKSRKSKKGKKSRKGGKSRKSKKRRKGK